MGCQAVRAFPNLIISMKKIVSGKMSKEIEWSKKTPFFLVRSEDKPGLIIPKNWVNEIGNLLYGLPNEMPRLQTYSNKIWSFACREEKGGLFLPHLVHYGRWCPGMY